MAPNSTPKATTYWDYIKVEELLDLQSGLCSGTHGTFLDIESPPRTSTESLVVRHTAPTGGAIGEVLLRRECRLLPAQRHGHG